ncbi:MAG: YciI family protein [Gaiellaceae bacterium]
MPQWLELFEYMQQTATSVDGAELDEPSSARTVRYHEGQPVVMDGPYAETKEQIGGAFFLECDDLDQAIDIASRVPLAARGSVEIRPVFE